MSLSKAAEWAKGAFGFSVKLAHLLEAQEKTNRALAKLTDEVLAIRLELERLKAREAVVIAEAKNAAAGAAASVTMQAVSDLSGRLGRIEGQLPRLSPPS